MAEVADAELPAAKAEKCLVEGRALLSAGNLDEALLKFSTSLILVPAEKRYFRAKGDAYLAMLDIKSALWHYRKVVELDRDDKEMLDLVAWLLDLEGFHYLERKEYTTASMFFDEAIQLNPTEATFWKHRTLCTIQRRKWNELGLDLDRWATVDYKNPEPLIIRAKFHWAKHLTSKGNADIQKAKALDPDHPEVKIHEVNAIEQLEKLKLEATQSILRGSYPQAIEALTASIEWRPGDFHMFLTRATAYRLQGEYEMALKDIEKASLVQSENTPAKEHPDITKERNHIINDLALSHITKESYGKAVELLSVVIQSEESLVKRGILLRVRPEYFISRGDCHRHMDNYQQALADYGRALEIAPGDSGVKDRIAIVCHGNGIKLFNKGDVEGSVLEFTRAIEYNPRVSRFYEDRGKASYFQQKLQEAFSDFREALALDPANTSLRSRLNQFSSSSPHGASNLMGKKTPKKSLGVTRRPSMFAGSGGRNSVTALGSPAKNQPLS